MNVVSIVFWCLLLIYSIMFLFCTYVINLNVEESPQISLEDESENHDESDEDQIDAFIRDYKNRNLNITTTVKKQQPTILSETDYIDV